jgi:hypothetical protein
MPLFQTLFLLLYIVKIRYKNSLLLLLNLGCIFYDFLALAITSIYPQVRINITTIYTAVISAAHQQNSCFL